MIAKADKGRTMVIIYKVTLKQKIHTFIPENQIIHLNKDPTDSFQKHIQHTMQKCNTIRHKNHQTYWVQIKPRAPKLNALIKTHKEDKPIRPVINNIKAPSYKLPNILIRDLAN
jgi:hypothetical protein